MGISFDNFSAVTDNQTSLNEQFSLQQHETDTSMFNFEKELRNDRESSNKVRRLSPTRYRFRVLDAQGRDIRENHHAETRKPDIPSKPEPQIHQNLLKPVNHYGLGPNHSTRVECAEPNAHYFPGRNTGEISAPR